MSKPVCLVWSNDANVYEQALTKAGLADRIEFHGLNADQPIPDDLAERTEAFLAWRPAGA